MYLKAFLIRMIRSTFECLTTKKGGVFQGQKLSCKCAEYKSLELELKRHNAQNRGIFYVVNYESVNRTL